MQHSLSSRRENEEWLELHAGDNSIEGLNIRFGFWFTIPLANFFQKLERFYACVFSRPSTAPPLSPGNFELDAVWNATNSILWAQCNPAQEGLALLIWWNEWIPNCACLSISASEWWTTYCTQLLLRVLLFSTGAHLVALEGEDRVKLGLHASYNWKSPQIHKKDTSTPPQPPLLNITKGWKYREVVKTLLWKNWEAMVMDVSSPAITVTKMNRPSRIESFKHSNNK